MTAPYFTDDTVTLYHGDALAVLRTLPSASVDCVVTSPPYFGLRDYGVDGQLGAEASPQEFADALVAVLREARRVLADDGTLWLNLGDSYSGRADGAANVSRGRARAEVIPARRNTAAVLGTKQLLGIPWRAALALQDDGWILRSEVIWAKPNPNPERMKDRPTQAHESVFLLTKSRRYYYDWQAIAEKSTATDARPQPVRARQLADEAGLTEAHLNAVRAVGMNDAGKASATQTGAGRNSPETTRLAAEAKAALGGYFREFLTADLKNARDVWQIPVAKFPEAHFATYPVELPSRCILAGSRPGGVVLDPFSGSGTTGLAAARHGRRYVGIDLNAEYLDLSLRTRLRERTLDFGEVTS